MIDFARLDTQADPDIVFAYTTLIQSFDAYQKSKLSKSVFVTEITNTT